MLAAPALVMLLTAQAAAAAPPVVPQPAMQCQVFTRGASDAPPAVRDWLAHSGDERVRVCAPGGRAAVEAGPAIYTGEGAVGRRGGVCSYASHGLTAAGSGPTQRLLRYESGEAAAMALGSHGGHDCPPAHPPGAAEPYTLTYDVSPAAFLSIMQLWSSVATSVAAFERELACCDLGGTPPGAVTRAVEPSDVRQRLRTAIGAGDMQAAVVTRIVRIPGSTFHHRYALFVNDPAQSAAVAGLYVIYLGRGVRGPAHIIGVGETD